MRKPWVYQRKNISTQLNSDVFTRVVAFDWHHTVEEEGERLADRSSSREISQTNLDAFVLKCSEEVDTSTRNKNVANLDS